ncbi:MAG: PspC domain-containing protein [Patescibacteria group bacterium]|nr:PspC domain-containing protein [Patescibacteria group bacterium]
MEKKLVRPQEGRILFGVCMGLASYFNIDPVLVRLVFIVLTIWGGAGIIIYLVCIFLIPEENGTKKSAQKSGDEIKKEVKDKVQQVASEIRTNFHSREDRNRGSQIFGLIVLLLGLIFLFQNIFTWFSFGRFWPLILILIGIIILFGGTKKEVK